MMLHIVAWGMIAIGIFNVLVMPLLFGIDRGQYGYKTWLSAVVSLALVSLLALRVLNII